jgi:hypothetical protein
MENGAVIRWALVRFIQTVTLCVWMIVSTVCLIVIVTLWQWYSDTQGYY